jgi:two-component system sensor histidine kinase/response regulator
VLVKPPRLGLAAFAMPVPKILIVDDQPINVLLLQRCLEREGISTAGAHDGAEALALVAQEPPDLILLDVMMPDIDGIEVCRRLQASEATRHIPVIFITARSTKAGKLEGLGAGAVDYITKPLDLDETLARVRTQLRFAAINREMLDLQRRLVEARRAATIGAVTQGIAHNLNNLLGVALGYLELLKARADQPAAVRENAAHADQAVQRIVSIVGQLTALEVRSPLPLVRCRLDALIAGALERFRHESGVAPPLVVDNPLGDSTVETHVEVFEEALGKVLQNAWESYGDRPDAGRPITIRTRLAEAEAPLKMLRLTVEDAGHGIEPAIRDQMFEPFVSTKRTVGVGMGLTVARHALRSLGGEVTLEDRPGGGTVAVLLHPLEKASPRSGYTQVPFGRT